MQCCQWCGAVGRRGTAPRLNSVALHRHSVALPGPLQSFLHWLSPHQCVCVSCVLIHNRLLHDDVCECVPLVCLLSAAVCSLAVHASGCGTTGLPGLFAHQSVIGPNRHYPYCHLRVCGSVPASASKSEEASASIGFRVFVGLYASGQTAQTPTGGT